MDDWQVSSCSFVQDASGHITVAFTLQMQCGHMHFKLYHILDSRLHLRNHDCKRGLRVITCVLKQIFLWFRLKKHFVKNIVHQCSSGVSFAPRLVFPCLCLCHFCLLFVFIFCFFVSLPFTSLSCLHVPHAAGFDMWQWKPSRVTLTSCWRVWAVPPNAVRMASARLPFPSLCSTGKPCRPPPSVCSHSWFLASL